MCSLGIEPTTFRSADAMFYHWATQEHIYISITGDDETPLLRNICMTCTIFSSQMTLWVQKKKHGALEIKRYITNYFYVMMDFWSGTEKI